MSERVLVLAASMTALLASSGPVLGNGLDEAIWLRYRAGFVTDEGRVVDSGQDGISHSEGQGYGMVLAEAFSDRATFDCLWSWTRRNLQVREDSLLAWKWLPDGGTVPDLNNATDGDILVAWALVRASARWDDPAYLEAALEILSAVRTKLVRHSAIGPILLPGEVGFTRNDGWIVNLSYWIFPALDAFQSLEPEAEWGQVAETGLELLSEGRFGSLRLPPDWLLVGDALRLPPDFEPVFGYDAIRIPLYLHWAGLEHPVTDAIGGLAERFRSTSSIAAETFLTGPTARTAPASRGMQAIVALSSASVVAADSPSEADDTMALPSAEGYYSSTLWLLARLAAHEARHRKSRPEKR
ncbi:MAG TPA: glycosyl hydrolase family 8 [Vicinamibacteria bacterium]|nr:glycosyl hydrolase family 8 [Vicinamibacteria bacterium]